MNRPLWQIFLNILLLAFAAQRGGSTAMLYLADAHPVTIATFGVQTAAALLAAIGVWIGGRAAIVTLSVLGGAMVLGAVLLGFVSRAMPAPAAVSQIFVALLAVAALTYVIRRESKGRG